MSALEIKPLQLPREHNQYRANETWRFQTTFQGKPIALKPSVQLATSNGTRQTLTSDAQGQVELTFPMISKRLKLRSNSMATDTRGMVVMA